MEKLLQLGAKPVTCSDSDGYICREVWCKICCRC
ncbi:Uncharacterised protein [Segatella copri]|nr:Uncharacterised protein [Segatella copri]